jgi:hypothetical protein
VYAGSTVFLFQIIDTPESRAQDLAIKYETMLLNNEWSMAAFEVLQFKWDDSTTGGACSQEKKQCPVTLVTLAKMHLDV